MSRVDESRVIDGKVKRVAHVTTCDECAGQGEVVGCSCPSRCNCGGELMTCPECWGEKVAKDFDCTCEECTALCRQLGQDVDHAVEGWECGDCRESFSSVAAAMNHAWANDHETYGVYAETGDRHVH